MGTSLEVWPVAGLPDETLMHGGKLAIVDLGTPQGVDNVDAYRLMIESFTWR